MIDRANLRRDPIIIAGCLHGEVWRVVPLHPNYFVSSLGRVCSVDFVTTNNNLRRGQLLKPGALPTGHQYVFLGRKNRYLVHHLVLSAFVGSCPTGYEGLHKDDNSSNNRLCNLRWGTRSENLHDAVRNGRKAIGEDISQSKLTDDAVRFIRANPDSSLTSLGKRFGVSAQAIKQVREFTTWKHVA